MPLPDLSQGVLGRAWDDSERLRKESFFWFWGLEIFGATAIAATSGALAAYWTPNGAGKAEAVILPAVGGFLGFVGGLLVLFLAIFTYQYVRAPYRQRDEARRYLQQAPPQPTETERALVLLAQNQTAILRSLRTSDTPSESRYEEAAGAIRTGGPAILTNFLLLTSSTHIGVDGDPTGTKGPIPTPTDSAEAMEFAAIRYLWDQGYVMDIIGPDESNGFLFDASEFADRVRAEYDRLYVAVSTAPAGPSGPSINPGPMVTGIYTGDGSDSQMITGMGVDNRSLIDALIKGIDDGRRAEDSPAEAPDGFIVHGDANVNARVYSYVLFYL